MRNKKRCERGWKRALDLLGSTAALLVLSPIIGGVALLVRVGLGAPVLFRQERAGRAERRFTLYKFRTMHEPDPGRGRITKEQRMTSLGRALRATSVDELPSLFNVLKGDMSLVGPRPLPTRYLGQYSPFEARRHEVRPGLTGWAQINGRNDLEWSERFRLDVAYVENRGPRMDLMILAKTVGVVLGREGIASAGHVTSRPFLGSSDAGQ